MIRLRLLGSLALSDPDGVEPRELIAQPKRLALLAYLAAAEPAGFKPRDVLLGLFWPERDDSRARAALRRSLYQVRRSLGQGAIVTRGDEVGVAPDGVWCDAVAFRTARAEGRCEDALAFYRGDLLPGFFVSSAPAFEQWMDKERGRLRLMATACARDLADGARRDGDLPAAVGWARRAAALDPDDESAVRLLVGLLDEQGDRAAALQSYEEFARRLREELDLEPSPETQALAAQVRGRRELRSPHLTAPDEEPAPNPHLIAVLPFAVRGPDDLAYLGEGLVDLLMTKLDGAGDLRAVDARAHVPAAAEIDVAGAKAFARRFGAGLVLVGSVTVAGRRLHIRASLHHLLTDRDVSADASGDGEGALFDLVDELVRQLLARQQASIGGQMARLAARTTSSLPALKAYLRGERAFRTGRYSDAMSAFGEATDHDDAFFLARYRLAAAEAATGRLDEARRAAAEAATGRDRLGPHQRLLLVAQLAWLDGELDAAGAAWLRALDERPEDVEAWYHLGHLLFEFNPLLGRSALEGRGPLERTLTLDPKHVAALGLLVRLAALERDVELVGSLVERLLGLSPTAEQALVVRGVRAWATDDRGEQNAVRADLTAAPPRLLITLLREVAIAAKESTGVDELAFEIARLPTATAIGALPHLVRAHSAYRRGDAQTVAQALDDAVALEPTEALLHRALIALPPGQGVAGNDPAALQAQLDTLDDDHGGGGAHAPVWPVARAYLLGLCAAVAGRFDEAEHWAVRCGAFEPPVVAPELKGNLAAGISAEVAWRRGDAAATLEHLRERRMGRGAWLAGTSPVFGSVRERALHAIALHGLGRHDESIEWRASIGQRSPFEIFTQRDSPDPRA